MSANAHLFPGGQPSAEVRLAALGYDSEGNRSGGIRFHARVVTVPTGSHLLRLYHHDGDFGLWWFTPHEYRRVCSYFGVDGTVLTQGRADGRSAFHGALALLSEWYRGDPGQLAKYHVVRTRVPLQAMYGEGDVAVTSDFGRTLKPIRLDGGTGARQVFFPEARTYKHAFEILSAPDARTDGGLAAAVAKLPNLTLPFE